MEIKKYKVNKEDIESDAEEGFFEGDDGVIIATELDGSHYVSANEGDTVFTIQPSDYENSTDSGVVVIFNDDAKPFLIESLKTFIKHYESKENKLQKTVRSLNGEIFYSKDGLNLVKDQEQGWVWIIDDNGEYLEVASKSAVAMGILRDYLVKLVKEGIV